MNYETNGRLEQTANFIDAVEITLQDNHLESIRDEMGTS